MKIKPENFKENGITLVEVIVAIFIITVFSLIVIVDFPKIKRKFALSRTSYQLAQDLRRTEDFGFSGVQFLDEAGDVIVTKGYGFYAIKDNKEYFIYADTNDTTDYRYTPSEDSIIETINILESEPGVYIKRIDVSEGVYADWVSINFNPPNPNITITTNLGISTSRIGIVLGLDLDDSSERTVYVNSSGLVEVE
jgi:Tfp pilus assembly protein PilE